MQIAKRLIMGFIQYRAPNRDEHSSAECYKHHINQMDVDIRQTHCCCWPVINFHFFNKITSPCLIVWLCWNLYLFQLCIKLFMEPNYHVILPAVAVSLNPLEVRAVLLRQVVKNQIERNLSQYVARSENLASKFQKLKRCCIYYSVNIK